jgi:NAD(P)-dependent dehydrogenase (short-subunit alcohol dehydrogenase family)
MPRRAPDADRAQPERNAVTRTPLSAPPRRALIGIHFSAWYVPASRTKADLDATVELLQQKGSPAAFPLQADITDDEQVQNAVREVAERWGELNILVNSTGPGGYGSFEDLSDERWLETIDIGAMGVIRCVQAALPLLRQAEWARIVNVSAHSTKRQSAHLVSYTAAKAMMTSVSKNLSLALASKEILVNTVSPGSFATETLKGWARSSNIDPRRSLRDHERDQGAVRPPRTHAARRGPRRDRLRHRVPRVEMQLVHDRRQRQRRRRFRLLLTAAGRKATQYRALVAPRSPVDSPAAPE